MSNADAINDLAESKRELERSSRETGISRRADIARLDRQIAAMLEAERRANAREQDRDRGR